MLVERNLKEKITRFGDSHKLIILELTRVPLFEGFKVLHFLRHLVVVGYTHTYVHDTQMYKERAAGPRSIVRRPFPRGSKSF